MNKIKRPSPDTQKVGFAVAQLMPHLIRGAQLDFFAKKNITQTQFLALASIYAYGQCAMGVLARNFRVSMPTMTGIVDRLVSAKYVSRFAKPEDRRQVIVELTQKGIHFIHQFQFIVSKRWSEALRGLKPEELSAFHRVIVKLQDQVKPAGKHDA